MDKDTLKAIEIIEKDKNMEVIKDEIDNKYVVCYMEKCLKLHILNILRWINKKVLKTYSQIEECARCRDCGRNVHDFRVVPNELWVSVVGKPEGVYCWDCFADRADKRNICLEIPIVRRSRDKIKTNKKGK